VSNLASPTLILYLDIAYFIVPDITISCHEGQGCQNNTYSHDMGGDQGYKATILSQTPRFSLKGPQMRPDTNEIKKRGSDTAELLPVQGLFTPSRSPGPGTSSNTVLKRMRTSTNQEDPGLFMI
jgi:hypothetical protein